MKCLLIRLFLYLPVCGLFLFGLSYALPVSADQTEAFDYTLGSLNGQGGWVTSGGEFNATTSEYVTLFQSGSFHSLSGTNTLTNTNWNGSYASTTYFSFRMKLVEPIATSTDLFVGVHNSYYGIGIAGIRIQSASSDVFDFVCSNSVQTVGFAQDLYGVWRDYEFAVGTVNTGTGSDIVCAMRIDGGEWYVGSKYSNSTFDEFRISVNNFNTWGYVDDIFLSYTAFGEWSDYFELPSSSFSNIFRDKFPFAYLYDFPVLIDELFGSSATTTDISFVLPTGVTSTSTISVLSTASLETFPWIAFIRLWLGRIVFVVFVFWVIQHLLQVFHNSGDRE